MSGERDRLERRYRRLLLAYPAPYRAERGDEIVGTFLVSADSDRRWPSIADVADVLRGGVRQHLRARGAAGLTAGVSVAATFALTAAVALAALWLAWIELLPAPSWQVATQFGPFRSLGAAQFGPFRSLGAAVWIAWLVTGLAALAQPARITRWFVLAALVATVAVEPIAAFSGYGRPPLLVLVPQVALGVLALGWPTRPAWTHRLMPAVIAVAAVSVWFQFVPRSQGILLIVGADGASEGYRWVASEVLTPTAIVLLLGSLLAACSRALNGDNRGLWSVLLLLLPGGLLIIDPLTRLADDVTGLSGPYGNEPPESLAFAGVTAAVIILAAGALLLAVRLTGRQIPRRAERCPTCGRSRT